MESITPTWTTGDRLRKAREVAGLGVNEMAELLNVSRNTVSNYEHDRTPITAAAMADYAEMTGVSVVWLMGLDVDLVRSRCFPFSGDPLAEEVPLPLFAAA